MNSIVLQKVRKQGIRFWDERTFWHEIIYKSLIPTFGKPTYLPIEFLIFSFIHSAHNNCNKFASAGTNVYFPHSKVLLLKRTNVRIVCFT